MEDRITLTSKEQKRGQVVGWVCSGRLTVAEAAPLLDLSERQVWRLKRAYREEGPTALAHHNRGRRPAHALTEALRTHILTVAGRAAYAGYNHTHLHELLVEEHGLTCSRRSLTRLLTTAGRRSPRRRRPRRYRARRARAPQRGLLVQVDASHHDWLEGRGPALTLLGAIDDATNEVIGAHFQAQETSAGYLRLLRASVRAVGIPVAWYADRHSCFQRNDKEPWTLAEELAGRRAPTQVARALEQLGITLIAAHSPQAKGRVERDWGTLQDRLVKELRRAGARTADEANTVLAAYLPRFNGRFAVAPANPRSAYRPLPRGLDLDGICSLQYVRTVANDNTVRLEERTLQVPAGPGRRSYAGCRVQLQERLDGELVVLYQGRVRARQAAPAGFSLAARGRRRGRELMVDPTPARQRHVAGAPSAPAGRQRRTNSRIPRPVQRVTPPAMRKPRADHPWRRPWPEQLTKSQANLP